MMSSPCDEFPCIACLFIFYPSNTNQTEGATCFFIYYYLFDFIIIGLIIIGQRL